MDAIFHRTSIRTFENKDVEPEKIDRIIRAALQAPSTANQQPWEFYVVTNPQVREQLSTASRHAGPVKDAPVGIVVCRKKNTRLPDWTDIDLGITSENIMLEADSLGLGSVMLGIAPVTERIESVNKILELPENLDAFAVIAIGYPAKVNPQQDRYDETRVHYVK